LAVTPAVTEPDDEDHDDLRQAQGCTSDRRGRRSVDRQLVEHGLVRPSFVPPRPIRELRELTRYRKALI
jgi:hypothetical protein